MYDSNLTPPSLPKGKQNKRKEAARIKNELLAELVPVEKKKMKQFFLSLLLDLQIFSLPPLLKKN